MKKFIILVSIFCLILASCGQPPTIRVNSTNIASSTPAVAPVLTLTPTQEFTSTVTFTPNQEIIPAAATRLPSEAESYLNDALDLIQNNALNSDKIDWPTLRTSLMKQVDKYKTPSDTYPVIEFVLFTLKDQHSFFLEPHSASAESTGVSPTPLPPEIKLIEDKFGYVLVRSYQGLNQEMINQYGTDMQNHVQEIDKINPCGWIIDLRGNNGGNMWPMLIGIGPLLGEGKAGSWIDADGNQVDWFYEAGKGLIGDEVVSEVTSQPYHLTRPDAPVAVLFGEETLSSGEIIAISFVGRPNTRSFGSASGGLTTANSRFDLSDGAIIFLTTAVDADRTGKVYGDAIIPDVQIEGDNESPGPVPAEALQWLNSQLACNK